MTTRGNEGDILGPPYETREEIGRESRALASYLVTSVGILESRSFGAEEMLSAYTNIKCAVDYVPELVLDSLRYGEDGDEDLERLRVIYADGTLGRLFEEAERMMGLRDGSRER